MPNRKALIIAINDYGGPPNNLPSCINDGNAFMRLLQASYNFRDVRSLYDAKATVANVEKELDWLFKDAKSDDRLVLYFSGHGYTKLVDEVMEEFLVLRDDGGKPALWQDDNLVAKTQNLPTGVLTIVLDSCFSGGMFKLVVDPTTAGEEAEIAQVKVFQPPPEEQAKAFEPLIAKRDDARPARISGYRGFGRAPAVSTRTIAKAFALESGTFGAARAARKSLSDATENAQSGVNGLLISACLETETAAASTSRTEGLSAFTHSLQRALISAGSRKPASDVLNSTAASLKSLGFRQTPLILERPAPGNLKNRTFLSLEVSKMVADMGERLDSAAGDEEIQKFLPLLGAILPAVIAAAPGIVNAVRGRRKELEIGADSEGSVSEDEMQKFLPFLGALLPAVISAAPGIINAVQGRRKGLELGDETEVSVSEEEIQKFLPLLGALLPAVVSAAPGIINAVRGRRKDLEFGGFESATEVADEKIFGAVLRVLPQVLRAAPGIVQAFTGQRKGIAGFEPIGAAEGEVTDEKIFGAVLRVLPQVLRAAPGIVQAFTGQHKGIAGFEPLGAAEVTDEKIFGAVLRVLPQVLRAAPGIVQAFTGQHRASGKAGGFEATGTREMSDEKIFEAVLRLLPQVLRATPGVAQAVSGQHTAAAGPESPGTAEVTDEKIFGAVLRILPQVLRAAPGIVQAFGSQKSNGSSAMESPSMGLAN